MDEKEEIRTLLSGDRSLARATPARVRTSKSHNCFPVGFSGTLLVAFSVVVAITMCTALHKYPNRKDYVTVVYAYLIALLVVSLLLLLLVFRRFPPKITLKPRRGAPDVFPWKIETAAELQRLVHVALFFGVVALAYSVWKIAAAFLCTQLAEPLNWLIPFYGILKCLFIIVLGFFLFLHGTALFYRHSASGLTLVVVAGSNASVWTFETSLAVFESVAQNLTWEQTPLWLSCVKSGTGSELSIFTPYLYPWVMQYSLVTTALLTWLWYSSGFVHVGKSSLFGFNSVQEDDESTSFLITESEKSSDAPTVRCTTKIVSSSLFSCSCFTRTKGDCGMFIGLVLALLFSGTILAASMLENKSATTAAALGYYGVRIGTDLVMVLCCLLAFFALEALQPSSPELNRRLEKRFLIEGSVVGDQRNYESCMSEERALVFGDWLTYVATTGAVAYESFSLYASAASAASSIDRPGGLRTISATTCLLELLFQAVLLSKARRCLSKLIQSNNLAAHRQHLVIRNLQQVALILVSGNVCLWATDSIFQIHSTHQWAIELHFYGSTSWDFITYLLYPLKIFFRFFSAVTLFNFWSRSRRFDHSDRSSCSNSV